MSFEKIIAISIIVIGVITIFNSSKKSNLAIGVINFLVGVIIFYTTGSHKDKGKGKIKLNFG